MDATTPRDDEATLRYVALVAALSAPLWVVGGAADRQLGPGLPLSALMAFCPLLAAAGLEYRRGGQIGVNTLLRRAVDYRRIPSPAWYLPILLLNPMVALAVYSLLRGRGVPLPEAEFRPGVVLGLTLAFALSAVGEEAGWSGYALDPLLARRGALQAALILGVVGATWHLIPFLQAHRSAEWIAWQCLKTVTTRVLIVWIYTGTNRSVFATILFHISDNLSAFLFPHYGSHYDPQLTGLILAGLAAGVTAANRLPFPQ